MNKLIYMESLIIDDFDPPGTVPSNSYSMETVRDCTSKASSIKGGITYLDTRYPGGWVYSTPRIESRWGDKRNNNIIVLPLKTLVEPI